MQPNDQVIQIKNNLFSGGFSIPIISLEWLYLLKGIGLERAAIFNLPNTAYREEPRE